MNRRELLSLGAAALLAGCQGHRQAAVDPVDVVPEQATLDGFLATLRGQCHPLKAPAAAALLGPTRDLHTALAARLWLPNINFYGSGMLCDASRRLAEVESAATRPQSSREPWRAHRSRMTQLRDDLHAHLAAGADGVTSLDVTLAAGEAAGATAKAATDAHARQWAAADARWLARQLNRALWQRVAADESLSIRLVDFLCTASWRLLEAELTASDDERARRRAVAEHVARLVWIGDDWLGGIRDAQLGLQMSVATYHLNLARTAAMAFGVPAGALAAPKHGGGALADTAVDTCRRVLNDWAERFAKDEPITPSFAHERCLWSARLAAAESRGGTTSGEEAPRRHAGLVTAFFHEFDRLDRTSEGGDAAERAVIRHAIAEAEAGMRRQS